MFEPWRCGDFPQDLRGDLLDSVEGLDQHVLRALEESDVVDAARLGIESDADTGGVSDRLGFEFTDVAGRHRLAGVAPVKHLMPQLVREDFELLRGVESREDLDLASAAAPERSGELLDVAELDALGLDESA